MKAFGIKDKKVTSKPYRFTADGWGTFEIPITIEWRQNGAKASLQSTEIKHHLIFDNKGAEQYFIKTFQK